MNGDFICSCIYILFLLFTAAVWSGEHVTKKESSILIHIIML